MRLLRESSVAEKPISSDPPMFLGVAVEFGFDDAVMNELDVSWVKSDDELFLVVEHEYKHLMRARYPKSWWIYEATGLEVRKV
jgi:hypothetical protein